MSPVQGMSPSVHVKEPYGNLDMRPPQGAVCAPLIPENNALISPDP